jgi:hypothetical protein
MALKLRVHATRRMIGLGCVVVGADADAGSGAGADADADADAGSGADADADAGSGSGVGVGAGVAGRASAIPPKQSTGCALYVRSPIGPRAFDAKARDAQARSLGTNHGLMHESR